MIRNFVIDFNYNGIAKHEVHIIADFNTDPKSLPNALLNDYKKKGGSFELVGITEIAGKGFTNPEELELVAMGTPGKGIYFINWYADKEAALRTLWQEPTYKVKQARRNADKCNVQQIYQGR